MNAFDISDTLAPNSDQLDAVDLLGGPQTFTIANVSKGKDDQPVNVHLAEFPRVWRPGKSMRRVLASCWGTDASTWVGRRVTLYCDESIRFGNDVVGGTRIAALSHIDRPKSIPLLVSRGKSATYKVDVLKAAPTTAIVSADLLAELVATFNRKGVPEDKWLAGVNHYTKGSATAMDAITEAQARTMLTELQTRADVAQEPAPEPDDETLWPETAQVPA